MPPGDHLVIPDGFMKAQMLLLDADTNHTSYVSTGVPISGGLPDQSTADAMASSFADNVLELLGDKLSLNEVVFIVGSAAPPYLSLAFSVSSRDGGASSNSEPQVQALVKLTSATPGKAGRGRTYLPRPDGSQINSRGALTSGYKSELLSGLIAWGGDVAVTPPVAGGSVIFHMKTGHVPTPPAPSPITGSTISALVATQRRRLAR